MAVVAMTVVLDLFSGLPNPSWVLTEAEVRALEQQVATLRPAPQKDVPARPGLGYRGFVIKPVGEGGGEQIEVYNGIVKVGRTVLEDPERSVERWVLQTGQAHLPDEITRMVKDELEARP